MRAFIVTLASCAVFTASVLFAGSTDTNSTAASYYRTVVSTNTGQYAIVDSKKEVVTLYDSTDHVIWTTNVVADVTSHVPQGTRYPVHSHCFCGSLKSRR